MNRAVAIEEATPWCPVCGQEGEGFLPLPDFYRENAERHGYAWYGKGEMTALATYACPKCGASDRERLYALWLVQEIAGGKLARNARFVHFAPETPLSAMIRRLGHFDYRTADIGMQGVDSREDLMALSFPDDCVDFFLCSHVLEHVENDGVAIRELLRVTRRGGRGILMAPVAVGLPSTIEDPAATSESDRWRLFGQFDHVRLYAHDDYVARIRRAGFRLQELGAAHFGSQAFARLGLKPSSILYVVEKP